MSYTQMLTGNPNTVKVWAKQVWIQTMQQTVFGHLMNRGAVYYPKELTTAGARGDSVTFSYVGKLTGIPIGEGGTLDGNEEALNTQTANMAMNLTRIGVLNPNDDTIEQQRTFIDFESTTKKLLTNRAKELIDTSMFYQLAGVNPTSLTINGTVYSNATSLLQVQGNNTIIAPTSNRIIYANNQANDQSLTSSDFMTLDLIDYAVEKASRSDQPLEMFDDDTYDLYCSPEQITDLKQNTSGRIQWFNYALAQVTAGKSNNVFENEWKNGMKCIGRYANVNIYQGPRVAYGVNTSTNAIITTVRRAVLVGKDAIAFASPFGGRASDSQVPLKFFSQLKDYEYYKGLEARLIYGMRKLSPSNKDDIGVMVIATYAAPHA